MLRSIRALVSLQFRLVIIFYPQESVSVHHCANIIEHCWYYNGLLLYFFEKHNTQHVR